MRKAISRKRGEAAAGVGERLRVLREDVLGMKQGPLADLLETTQDRISRWENERDRVGLGSLRLASDLTTDDLAAYRWLRDGGTVPVGLSKLTSPGPGGRVSVAAAGVALHRAYERLWDYAGAYVKGHPGTDLTAVPVPLLTVSGMLDALGRELGLHTRPGSGRPEAGSA